MLASGVRKLTIVGLFRHIHMHVKHIRYLRESGPWHMHVGRGHITVSVNLKDSSVQKVGMVTRKAVNIARFLAHAFVYPAVVT